MTRLRQVSRDEATAPIVGAMYDFVFGPGRDPVTEPGTATGTPGDWWTTFALVPDVLKHCVDGFALYRSPDRALPAELRELGQFRAGWGRQSQFVYSQHAKSCRALGMPEEKIAALPHWQVADCWSPVERAVLAYTDALVLEGGRVSDGVFAALREHLSDEQILELTYITCLYEMHATMSRALRTEWDDRDEPIVEVAGDHGSLAPEVGVEPGRTAAPR
jgi:alkylhydroperoxidase family enzyme